MKKSPVPTLSGEGDPVQAEAERALASLILGWLDPADGAPLGFLTVADRLTSDDWTDPLWRAVWNTVSTMVEDQEVVSPVSVLQKLRAEFGMEAGHYATQRIIGASEASVAGYDPHGPLAKATALLYARELREGRRRREAQLLGAKMMEDARTPGMTPLDLIERAQERVTYLQGLVWDDAPIETDALAEAEAQLADMKASGGVSTTALKTGLLDVDDSLSIEPRALTVVAGGTGVGKTTLAVNISDNMAKLGKRVMMFSLEMGAVEIEKRRLISQALISLGFFKGHKSGPPDWANRLAIARTTLKQRPFRIVYAADLNATAIRARARQEKTKLGLDVVVIDYIQLVDPPKVSDNRARDVATVSRACKGLAMELDCAVIAVSQLSRAPASRKTGEPELRDLRESGAIEQDADNVVMLWQKPDDTPGITRVKVAKQRNGPTFTTQVFHDQEHFRFASLALGHDDSGEAAGGHE